MARAHLAGAVAAAIIAAGAPALAAGGPPQPWEWGLPDPASPIAREVVWFYDVILLPMMVLISAFVLALMAYIVIRFRRTVHPEPSGTTHNTTLEVIWTTVPILILVVIAIPSLRLLYYQESRPEADLTVKAIGNQWFWSYEYPDHGGLAFESLLAPDDALEPGQPRLLTTDTVVALPAGKVIRVQVTSNDVIHAWALPAAGVKLDAVPGRLNEMWLQIDEPGTYYGQCSELCGLLHGFMPIMVEVMEEDAFADWIEEMQVAQGLAPGVRLASRNSD